MRVKFLSFGNVSCEAHVLEVHAYCHFLGTSRAKRSFWEFAFSFFANVSCETLVLEVDIFNFLRMSPVKRLFWKSIFLFSANVSCKRSFWEFTFSFFANVSSCETLVLEAYLLNFCECLV